MRPQSTTGEQMEDRSYWKTHYVVHGNADAIERHVTVRHFSSGRDRFALLCFEREHNMPCIVISPGSGGHPYVFAELGHEMHRRGYNVFIMPKHGGHTVPELMERHRDALAYLAHAVNRRIGVYAEGLGGYVAFYLALMHVPMQSIVCQNSPALMTDQAYHEALLQDTGPWTATVRRRKIMLPIAKELAKVLPAMKIPIWMYLDWKALIDTNEGTYDIERQLVEEGYLRDPDFDRWYPLAHVMSLISTPPPNPLADLCTPTMFIVARGGPTPAYIKGLYNRMPPIKKKLTEVNGSVYWMLSHPVEAADIVCDWFDETV
jgi:pimeloyl-ACP methyl ester carboxylesterase